MSTAKIQTEDIDIIDVSFIFLREGPWLRAPQALVPRKGCHSYIRPELLEAKK